MQKAFMQSTLYHLDQAPQAIKAQKAAIKRTSLKDALRHFLLNGGKIIGRHQDEDLSPVEIIN